MREQASTLPVHPFWLSLLSGMVAGITVNAAAAFGEEMGGRGLFQRKLEPLGLWSSSAISGVGWDNWYAPLILHGHNNPEHLGIGVFLMPVMTVLASPLRPPRRPDHLDRPDSRRRQLADGHNPARPIGHFRPQSLGQGPLSTAAGRSAGRELYTSMPRRAANREVLTDRMNSR
jgi:hypothetical protein